MHQNAALSQAWQILTLISTKLSRIHTVSCPGRDGCMAENSCAFTGYFLRCCIPWKK